MAKRNKKGNNDNTQFDFALTPLNYTPVDYQHSAAFEQIMSNPLEFARKLLGSSSMCPDELCNPMIDAYIDSLCTDEIARVRDQHVHHLDTINRIVPSAASTAARALRRKETLEEDRYRLHEKLEELKEKECNYDV